MIKSIQFTLFIFSFLYCNFIFSQDSIPDKNKKVLEYANTQIGKKVKSGICFDFVKGALDIATPKWDKRRKKKWIFFNDTHYVYGKRIHKNNLLPGDIIYYKWKSLTTTEHASHFCIVYSIDKNGNIKVAEQNTQGTLKKSIVEINDFDFTGESWGAKIYNLRFYRPY